MPITTSRRAPDVVIHSMPQTQISADLLICVFCNVEASQESHKCYRCGEYKGIMTTAEARQAGYQIEEDC